MHRLVPFLIVDNLRKNILRGQFPCAALFVDISGFTDVTDTLMSHGQHGAEVMATVMRAIFSPPVRSVFEQGGFITNFAGDAFTAVFPISSEWPTNPSLRALATAWQIQKHMADNVQQHTHYGSFEFSVKVGLAEGEAVWGILPRKDGQRAVYYFKGSAIVGCADAEHHARAGDIVANQSFYEAVKMHARAQSVGDHWRIVRPTTTLPQPREIQLPPPDPDLMTCFFPRVLLEEGISGEFRQVLYLFVNLKDEPDHAQLDRFAQHLFQLQDKYGGILNRIDFADKGCHMLLFWGAPTSHENDITRVLNFILECRELSEIPLRAGIAYRIAHAGSIGSELAEEYTCYGRGANLAARHMTAAGWDEIWVDGETARRAEGEFTFESLGNKRFKGFAEPQPVFLITGYREDIPTPFADRPLAGRQTELRRLQKAIQPIYNGRFAGVVTVIGEAGIGKSRLVYELLDPISSSGEAALFLCQTDEIIRQSLNPFRYFLRHYFDQSTTRDEVDNNRRFGEILSDLLAVIPDGSLKNELDRTSSFLGSLIGLFWEGSLYEQLEPELRFENSLSAIKTLFRAESLRRPVIIQLEDAHWLDPDSKLFLNRLTRNMVDFPLVLVISSRENLAADLFAPDVPIEIVNLEPLGQESLNDLAQAIIGGQPSPNLVKLVGEHTEGNPFFVEQMLLYLQENDLLQTVGGQIEGILPDDGYIPADVRALLTDRLDRLPPSVMEMVLYAAVLGREFETPILFEMMAKGTALRAKLTTAADESIWIALDQVRYLFQHNLLREAAYNMQLRSRLRQLHKLAARAFENQDPDLTPRYLEIAYHYDKAEERKQASRYYGEAGEQAKENYSNAEAINHFSRGLELTDEIDFQSRYTLLCGRETIYQLLGRRDEQQDDLNELEKLLDQHPDALKMADLALRQSSYALVMRDYEASKTAAKRSLEFAREANNVEARAKAHHRHGRTLWEQGLAGEAEYHLLRALSLVRNIHNREIEAECLYDLSVVNKYKAAYDQAKMYLNEAVGYFQDIEDKQGLARCQNLFGMINDEQGYFIASQHHYMLALDLCHEAGWRYAETYILINIGIGYIDLGNYKNALLYHNQAFSLAKESGDRHAEAVNLDSLGLISFYKDDLVAAIHYYRQALEIRESVSNKRSKAYVLTHLGHAQAQRGEYNNAESSLLDALKIRQDLNEEALIMDVYSGLALISYLKGDQDSAYDYVVKVLTWIRDNGFEGLEFPVQVYLICYQVLANASQTDHNLQAAAGTVLEEGHALLMDRADRIQDKAIRQQFIDKVPYNRELQALWLNSHE